MKFIAILSLSILCFSGCTVYRSPERKDFESESANFHVQNLKQMGCSNTSLSSRAEAVRLITILPADKNQTENASENIYLYEFIINNQSYFESDNLKGDFCAFEIR